MSEPYRIYETSKERELRERLEKVEHGAGRDNGRAKAEDVGTKKPLLLDVIRVWEHEEPEPRTWTIEGLVPDGVITALFGDGGMGKSYIALYWGMLTCLGTPFCGRHVIKQDVLYLDAELDDTEFKRRAYKVARGMGLFRPPVGLHYANLPGSIKDPAIQERARLTIAGSGVGLTILDSLTVAAVGSDPKEAKDVIELMRGMRDWGTVVAVDHITKVQAGTNLSTYSQFGSAFKKYLVRSSIKLIQAAGGGVSLQQDKNNFGPKGDPLYLSMKFDKEEVSFRQITGEDDAMAGIDEHLPVIEQVYQTLLDQEGEESTPLYLAQIMSKSEGRIKNYLTALRQQGRVKPGNTGTWIALRKNAPAPEEPG